MIQNLTEHWIVAGLHLIDIVDILIIAFLVYRILLLIRRTRAIQTLTGLVILIGLFYFSARLNLYATHWVLDKFLSSFIVLVIIIFQHDIRKGLAKFGRLSFFRSQAGHIGGQVIDEIVKATTALANRRIGALIVIERDNSLSEFIEGGTEIDAAVVRELLISIFLPNSPIHDGAVVVQGNRLVAAGCLLPLSVNPDLSKVLGTRHRAAVGLTEETDAVAIVISEEQGSITLVYEGKIARDLDGPTLRKVLHQLLIEEKNQ